MTPETGDETTRHSEYNLLNCVQLRRVHKHLLVLWVCSGVYGGTS